MAGNAVRATDRVNSPKLDCWYNHKKFTFLARLIFKIRCAMEDVNLVVIKQEAPKEDIGMLKRLLNPVFLAVDVPIAEHLDIQCLALLLGDPCSLLT